MELSTLRRLFPRRLWPLILVPLVALIAGGVYAALQPPTYEGTAAMVVTPPGGGDNAATMSQVQSSMVSLATSDSVAREVAQQLRLNPEVISDGVSASRGDASDSVLVTYVSTDREQVGRVLKVLPDTVVRRIYAPTMAEAALDKKAAEKSYTDATSALKAARAKVGSDFPDREYAARVTEVSSLRVALANARARVVGDVDPAPIEKALRDAETARSQLISAQMALEGPLFTVEQARTVLTAQVADLATTQRRLTNAVGQTVAGPVEEQTKVLAIVRTAVGAGVIGLGATVFIALLVALVRRSREESTDELVGWVGPRPGPGPAPGPGPRSAS